MLLPLFISLPRKLGILHFKIQTPGLEQYGGTRQYLNWIKLSPLPPPTGSESRDCRKLREDPQRSLDWHGHRTPSVPPWGERTVFGPEWQRAVFYLLPSRGIAWNHPLRKGIGSFTSPCDSAAVVDILGMFAFIIFFLKPFFIRGGAESEKRKNKIRHKVNKRVVDKLYL